MKNIILKILICLAATFPFCLSAESIEAFDYEPESLLSATREAPEAGWSSGWKGSFNLAANLPDSFIIGFDSLEHDAMQSRGLKPTGGRLVRHNLQDLSLFFRGLVDPVDFSTEGDTYISFLVYWTRNHSNEAARLRLQLGEDGRTFIGFQANGTDLNSMRLTSRLAGQDDHAGETAYFANTVYLVVVKVTAVARGTDTLSASVFGPDDQVGEEPSTWEVTSTAGTNEVFRAIGWNAQLYAGEGLDREFSIDEIRVGSSWSSVTSP